MLLKLADAYVPLWMETMTQDKAFAPIFVGQHGLTTSYIVGGHTNEIVAP